MGFHCGVFFGMRYKIPILPRGRSEKITAQHKVSHRTVCCRIWWGIMAISDLFCPMTDSWESNVTLYYLGYLWLWHFYDLLAHLSRKFTGELIGQVGLHRLSSTLFKHLLLRNRLASRSQTSYGASMGWVNRSLCKGPGHRTKMAAMSIYGKNL